jgi:type IV secretory pathway VirB2 component (pilin)
MRPLARLVLVPLVLVPSLAVAAPPGGEPLIGFGNEILNFLTGPLAYIIFGVGIAIAAISLVMGSRDGIQRAIYALIGGGLLFGCRAVIEFVRNAAGG